MPQHIFPIDFFADRIPVINFRLHYHAAGILLSEIFSNIIPRLR